MGAAPINGIRDCAGWSVPYFIGDSDFEGIRVWRGLDINIKRAMERRRGWMVLVFMEIIIWVGIGA